MSNSSKVIKTAGISWTELHAPVNPKHLGESGEGGGKNTEGSYLLPVNRYCQFDWIRNHLRGTPLNTLVRGFLG